MGGRTAAVVGRMTRAGEHREVSDRDLLRRFAAEGDQAAFGALVRRHAGLVLGVCKRTLANDPDAEDACQAVFVVLARKAGSGRWQSSIANWLYATARRVSRNARVAAARRARREGRAAVPEAVTDLDRMSGREAFAVLDEELDRLPPRYREPLVLCYLQGLTRDEAAARLAVSPATLKSQLDRGRKRLAAALTKRGIAVGLGLLASATTSPAGASPPRLIHAIRAAVGGRPSPAVAALAEGVSVNGLIQKIAVVVMLGAATIAVGLGLGEPRSTTAGQTPDQETPAKAAAPVAKPVSSPTGPTVRGRVLSPAGKPLAGAKLILIGKAKPAELGASGTDGRFTLTLPTDWAGGYLIAKADGVGIDFRQLGELPKDDIELRTVADLPVHGRLLDTEGKPVAGATVRVDRLGTSPGNSLDPILETWKKLDVYSASPAGETTIWAGTAALWTTTTDRDGRFELRGLGVERLAVLHLSGGGVTDSEAYVAVRKGLDPKPYNDAVVKNARTGFGNGRPRWRLYGPAFSVVAEREKLIRGRVTDVDTGKPRSGVHVLLTRTDGGDLLQVVLDGWTDKDGHYEIHGARKASSYMVEVAADARDGYVQAQARGGDTSGYDPVTIDVKVKKGVVVTGRLIDKGTGKAVRGWALIGIPQANSSAKDYPECNSSAWFPMQETDAHGRFRVVAIPGLVLLFGQPDNATFNKYKPPVADPKYPQLFKKFGDHTAYFMAGGAISPLQGRACRVLDIKPGTATVEQDLELVPADPPAKADGEKKK
jgi:RNA polymerase sigma factor (sigma-70 family)